jgi:hypothetical protein
MRSSAVLRRLPALPPKADWPKKFPLTTFNVVNRLSSYGGNKSGKRTNVVDPALADEIVHSLDIDKATHVVEAYPGEIIWDKLTDHPDADLLHRVSPGMGALTRALLSQPSSIVAKLTAIEPASAFRKYGLGSEEPEEYLNKEERIGRAWKQLTVKQQPNEQQPGLQTSTLDKRLNSLEPENSVAIEEDEDVDSMLEHTAVGADKKASSLLEQLKNEAIDPHERSEPEQQNPSNISTAKQSTSSDRPPGTLVGCEEVRS